MNECAPYSFLTISSALNLFPIFDPFLISLFYHKKWINFWGLGHAYKDVNGIDWSQYRNKIKVAKLISVFNQSLAAFVDNEMFYNDNVDQYNENRAKFGLSKKINDNVSGALYYMYRANKGANDWSGVNIIGTSLSISL